VQSADPAPAAEGDAGARRAAAAPSLLLLSMMPFSLSTLTQVVQLLCKPRSRVCNPLPLLQAPPSLFAHQRLFLKVFKIQHLISPSLQVCSKHQHWQQELMKKRRHAWQSYLTVRNTDGNKCV
jgi:hypothetical protein